MHLIEWSVGLGGKRAPKTNKMFLRHFLEYDEVSQILPLAKIFPRYSKCEHFGSREAKIHPLI